MNTEAIIEQLLQSKNEQILTTSLDDLHLPVRVYRSLWRSRVRTIGDVAQTWSQIMKVRNFGEKARGEILGALETWSRSFNSSAGLPNPAEPGGTFQAAPEGTLDRRLPIEALHLSQRTYRALKRNQIDTLDDIYREWDKITSIRNVGQGTLREIQTSLAALHSPEMDPSESVGSFADPDGMGLKTHLTRDAAPLAVDDRNPNHESQPAKDDLADRATAEAVDSETMSESQTQKYVITEGGVVVRVDLLQADESRKSREERWRNVSNATVSAKPQDYAPKNIFQAIGEGPDKIASPIQRLKKTPRDSNRKYTNLLRVVLETLEKANRPRKVRSTTCPLCRAVMTSKRFEKHLVDMHPEAFQELQDAVSGSLGWQNIPGVGLAFRDPLHENHVVKCPLCEHRDRYKLLYRHIQASHPEVDPGLMMGRFSRANRSKDYESLIRYQAELNELVKEYERLKQGQDKLRDDIS